MNKGVEMAKRGPQGKFTVTISDAAHKIMPSEGETQMFVKYALMAFKEEPNKNTFMLGKLKIVCVIDGSSISIITEEEMKEILGKK